MQALQIFGMAVIILSCLAAGYLGLALLLSGIGTLVFSNHWIIAIILLITGIVDMYYESKTDPHEYRDPFYGK